MWFRTVVTRVHLALLTKIWFIFPKKHGTHNMGPKSLWSYIGTLILPVLNKTCSCLWLCGTYCQTLGVIDLSELFLCTSWFNRCSSHVQCWAFLTVPLWKLTKSKTTKIKMRHQKTFGPIVEIWNSRQHPSHCLFWNQSRLC